MYSGQNAPCVSVSEKISFTIDKERLILNYSQQDKSYQIEIANFSTPGGNGRQRFIQSDCYNRMVEFARAELCKQVIDSDRLKLDTLIDVIDCLETIRSKERFNSRANISLVKRE